MKNHKSKKKSSERVSSRPVQKKINPFEVHVNKKKHNVLGQRSKTEKGLPGIARTRALKKRKATLLQEYNLKSKNNMFVDRRIGEKDATMTTDDKIIARYTTERMRFHSKKSLYNLDDNEVLTHRGESLADIEKFEDPKSDEEDEDDDGRNRDGKLGENFVSEAHFGGGMLKRVDGDSRSRKDLIDQMIADSKLKKAEQQKLREETLDLTEKLDTEWKDLLPLVHSSKPRDESTTLASDNKFASYDKLSKELKFEARGRATDKLKSETEIAQADKKQLEEMEKQRLARMFGETSEGRGPKHRSADDLDEDGFDYYEESHKKKNVNDEGSYDEEEESDVGKEANRSEADSEDEDEIDDEECAEEEECSQDEEAVGEAGEDGDESGDSSSDDMSDLKDSESDSDEENLVESERKTRIKISDKIENVVSDLPFTLSVPETYDEFSSMIFDRSPEQQAVVLERMVKSNHPSLPDGSRQKLINLFKYCLQHLQDVCLDPKKMNTTFRVLDKISPWLYDLTHFATATTCSILCDVIKEKYGDFLRRPRFPSLDTLVFFKLIGVLYPTSDYRHRLVTPTLIFMQHILASSRIKSSTDVAVGLFLATLILEFTTISKRLTPEAINFLRGLLRCAQPKRSCLPSVPHFNSAAYNLRVTQPNIKHDELKPLAIEDLIHPSESDDFKLRALNLTLGLLDEYFKRFQNSEEMIIVEPFVPLLDIDNYPECLKKSVMQIDVSRLQEKKLYKLVAIKKRPKPLKLYEPKIEEVYTFRKRKLVSKEKDERDRLLHKYKKEVKGALREIRRDNAFLSKLKLNETIASDKERKRKVKEIFGDAAQQAGEIRKMKRAE